MIEFSKKLNVEIIWFKFLYYLNQVDPFETHETLFILNFFLNLTTNAEYYKRIESKLFCIKNDSRPIILSNSSNINLLSLNKNSFSSLTRYGKPESESDIINKDFLLNRIDHYDKNKDLNTIFEQYVIKFSSKTQKLKIHSIWFLDVLIRVLFEVVEDDKIKRLFLYILHDFIKISNYNLAYISNDSISLKLMLYFIHEENTEIRKKISSFLFEILKNNCRVSHIQILTSLLKFPINEEEILKVSNNLMIFENRELLKSKFRESSLFIVCFKELSEIMTKITEFHKNNVIEKDVLYFSGNSSGIILKDFNNFPSFNFSLICQIKFENLMPEKRFIANEVFFMKLNESLSDYPTTKQSFNFIKPQKSLPKFPEISKIKEIDKVFEQKVDNLPPEIQKMSYLSKQIPKKYKPILFSLVTSSNSFLDIYLEDEKPRVRKAFEKEKNTQMKNLKIKVTKKEKIYEQTFLYDFDEGKWYDLAIICSSITQAKTNFVLFLDGIEIPYKSNGEMHLLGEFLHDFKSLNLFSIGCSSPSFLQNDGTYTYEKNLELNDCFCGELKNFLILDMTLNIEQIKNVMKKLKEDFHVIEEKHLIFKNTNNVYKSKNIIMSLDDFSILADIKMGFDFVWVEVKNKNEIKFLEPDKVPIEKIVPCPIPSLKKNIFNQILDIFTKKKNMSQIKKNKHYNDFTIYTKEVTLIEKSTFFEILFTLGNVEVLLYLFEIILTKDNKLKLETKYFFLSFSIF